MDLKFYLSGTLLVVYLSACSVGSQSKRSDQQVTEKTTTNETNSADSTTSNPKPSQAAEPVSSAPISPADVASSAPINSTDVTVTFGPSMMFQDYDNLTTPPLNPLGGGTLYPVQGIPSERGEGGDGVISISKSDAVSGSSLLNHMMSGRLYMAWWNNDGTSWHFAHETKADKATWKFNTYNRMVLWIKMPNYPQPYEKDGGNGIELGTYVKRITNEDPYSQETGGTHFYHQLNIPSLGAWTQVVIGMYPDHSRGIQGDPGPQNYPTVAGGDPANTYNYFDTLTSFYIDNPYDNPTSYPADYFVDNIQFTTVPYVENDKQVKSLTSTYVAADNRIVVTWNAGWAGDSTHEVRYAFSDIHKNGWASATPAPNGLVPLNASGYFGRYYDSTALPLAGHDLIYIAIKPQNSSLFTQIAIPLKK